jgi:heme exporter protein D
VNTAPFSSWDDATSLVPWGPESFGVWLFLVIAIVAFVAMLVRAVQHENEAMKHIVSDVHRAEANGEVAEPEAVVAAAASA